MTDKIEPNKRELFTGSLIVASAAALIPSLGWLWRKKAMAASIRTQSCRRSARPARYGWDTPRPLRGSTRTPRPERFKASISMLLRRCASCSSEV